MMNELNKLFSNDIVFSLIILSASVLVGIIISLIAIFILKRWQKSSLLKNRKVQFEYLKGSLFSLFPSLCIMFVLPLLRFPERIQYTISHVVQPWFIISVGWLLIGIFNGARETFLSHYDITVKDNLQARRIYTQTRVITSIINVIIIVLTAALVLMAFEKVRQIGTSLLASAGIIGVILGFAAQKTLGNFIAGLQIALAQPIRIDDVVIVEEEWGWIEEITLTYVVVRIWDLRRLVVPISYFIEKPFQNWTRVSADILGSVFVYADYTVPVKELRSELTRILEESPNWDKKVNVLQVTNATAQTVEIRALMSAPDSPTAWKLRCEVREKLLEFLQKRFPECLPRTRVELKKPQGE
ncbi:MAG: mechanosensitive ion channel domain-containing protein, partial [Candidatus Omnitrophota bacterium]